jgi:hypothetical protein
VYGYRLALVAAGRCRGPQPPSAADSGYTDQIGADRLYEFSLGHCDRWLYSRICRRR